MSDWPSERCRSTDWRNGGQNFAKSFPRLARDPPQSTSGLVSRSWRFNAKEMEYSDYIPEEVVESLGSMHKNIKELHQSYQTCSNMISVRSSFAVSATSLVNLCKRADQRSCSTCRSQRIPSACRCKKKSGKMPFRSSQKDAKFDLSLSIENT